MIGESTLGQTDPYSVCDNVKRIPIDSSQRGDRVSGVFGLNFRIAMLKNDEVAKEPQTVSVVGDCLPTLCEASFGKLRQIKLN